jgi:arylsulfatase A-like enzyme
MTDKPNFIYIFADDMGYGDVSCLNENSKIQTPHIDRLAAEGMRFGDAHSSSAVCTPSRYSVLTGRYNWRSRLKQGVFFGYDEALIESGRMTVASFLKEHDYATACIGKWHLGWKWEKLGTAEEDVDYTKPISDGPTSRGFDTFFGISASLDMPPYVYIENDNLTAIPDRIIPECSGKRYWREGPIAPDFEHEDVLPKFTRKAVEWLEERAGEDAPFFLYFPLPAPHTPILPLPEFQGKSGTNEYGDFCLQVDDIVGQLMAAVERQGVAENTIIIFTADNGCSPMVDIDELNGLGHQPSYVFRGHKADIYEGGHRIPFVMRWPARMQAGGRTDETICLNDLLATCADILGVDLPDDAGEDSVSNLPLWEGRALDRGLREATVHHSINGSFSIRKGKWKLEMCAGSGGWSYPQPGEPCEGLPPIQLYDLDADIGETENVYDQHPEIVEELKSLLTQYVENGRSTPGEKQGNADGVEWPQLWWLLGNGAGNGLGNG